MGNSFILRSRTSPSTFFSLLVLAPNRAKPNNNLSYIYFYRPSGFIQRSFFIRQKHLVFISICLAFLKNEQVIEIIFLSKFFAANSLNVFEFSFLDSSAVSELEWAH